MVDKSDQGDSLSIVQDLEDRTASRDEKKPEEENLPAKESEPNIDDVIIRILRSAYNAERARDMLNLWSVREERLKALILLTLVLMQQRQIRSLIRHLSLLGLGAFVAHELPYKTKNQLLQGMKIKDIWLLSKKMMVSILLSRTAGLQAQINRVQRGVRQLQQGRMSGIVAQRVIMQSKIRATTSLDRGTSEQRVGTRAPTKQQSTFERGRLVGGGAIYSSSFQKQVSPQRPPTTSPDQVSHSQSLVGITSVTFVQAVKTGVGAGVHGVQPVVRQATHRGAGLHGRAPSSSSNLALSPNAAVLKSSISGSDRTLSTLDSAVMRDQGKGGRAGSAIVTTTQQVTITSAVTSFSFNTGKGLSVKAAQCVSVRENSVTLNLK